MARLNNDARKILCDMVMEKAGEKRSALVNELNSLDKRLDDEYINRLGAARVKIDEAIRYAKSKIDTILTEHFLEWGGKCYCEKCGIGDILINNDLKPVNDLTHEIRSVETGATLKRRSELRRDIEELDAKVTKAKREILLRAALGMKYDEVMAIVNGFEF